MENNDFIQPDAQNIIKTYRFLSEIFFKFGLYIILFLVSIVFVFSINIENQEINNQNQKYENFIKEKDVLKGNTVAYFDKKNISGFDLKIPNGFDLKILRGSFSYNNNTIFSVNNLVYFGGFVYPYNAQINTKLKPKNIESFLKGNYQRNDLKDYLNFVVLLKNKDLNTDTSKSNNKENVPILKYFKLSCLQKSKITDYFCDINIDNFLKSFYKYDILNSTNIDDFKNIFSILYNTDYKNRLCDGVLNYVYYSFDTNQNLYDMLSKCSGNYLKIYSKISDFKDFIDARLSNADNSKIYNDTQLNEFKLVSLQNVIYRFIENKATISEIKRMANVYISYIEEILKNENKVSNFYKDEIYIFNNDYLYPKLIDFQKTTNDDEITKLIEGLNNIHKGDYTYKGLEKDLLNPSIVTTFSVDSISTQISLATIFDNFIKDATYLSVVSRKINEDTKTITLQTIMHIKTKVDSEEIQKDIDVTTILNYTNSDFIVKKVLIKGNKDLTSLINQNLSNNSMTLAQLHDFIQKNSSFKIQTVNTCDIIKNIIKELSENNHNVSMKQCSNDILKFEKNTKPEDKDEKPIVINYTFYVTKDLNITNVEISHPEIASKIKDTYKAVNNVTFSNYIKKVLMLEPSSRKQNTLSVDEIARINNVFNKYLGIKATNIQPSGQSNYIVYFTLGVSFKADFNVDKNYNLYNLYFYEKEKNISIKVNNFSINLVDSDLNNVNTFKLKPLEYIKKIDNNAYEEYMKKTKN